TECRAARTREDRARLRWGSGAGQSRTFFIRRRDRRQDAAARGEVADDRHAPRGAGGDEIVEDLVGDRLVEDALVAELEKIVLQRLQLETPLVGDVGDADLAEVGQPRLWTYRRELRVPDRDLVIAARLRVRERLQGHGKKCSIQEGFDRIRACFWHLSAASATRARLRRGIQERAFSKGDTDGRGQQDGQIRTLLALRGSLRSQADAGARIFRRTEHPRREGAETLRRVRAAGNGEARRPEAQGADGPQSRDGRGDQDPGEDG